MFFFPISRFEVFLEHPLVTQKVAYFRAAAGPNSGRVLKPIWTGPSPKPVRENGPPAAPSSLYQVFSWLIETSFRSLHSKHNQFQKIFSFQLKTEFTIFHFFPQKKLNLPDKNFLYSSKIHIFLQKKILNTARGATRRPVRSPSGESRQCAPDGLSDDLEIRPAFSSPVLQLCLWSLPPKTIHQKTTLALLFSILGKNQKQPLISQTS